MLRLALSLDYGDEIGGKKMFALVQKMLSQPLLPPGLVPRCLDVLRRLSCDEPDLIRVVVEIINELRDIGDEAEDCDAVDRRAQDGSVDVRSSLASPFLAIAQSVNTVNPKTRARKDVSPEIQVNLDTLHFRRLTLCTGMLQRVTRTMDKKSTLKGLLFDLIMPATKHHNIEIQAQGLTALGLYCLISEEDAAFFLPIFVSLATEKTSEILRCKALQIIFDSLMAHRKSLVNQDPKSVGSALSFLVSELRAESTKERPCPKILTLLAQGVAKLIFVGMIRDHQATLSKALQSLLVVYLLPCTAQNPQLKQILACFTFAYSHSCPKNQRVIRELFVPAFRELAVLYRNCEGAQDSMVQVADMWVHWTDPAQLHDSTGRPGKAPADQLIQFDLANDIIRELLKREMPKEDQKILVPILNKLYIPNEVDIDKIRTLKLLIYTLNQARDLPRPIQDGLANKALKRFDASISKQFEAQLKGFNEVEYSKLEELKDLFDFLDDIIPEEEETLSKPTAPSKQEKRMRSDSNTSDGSRGPSSAHAEARVKRPRLSDCESKFNGFDGDSAKSTPTLPPPPRSTPRHSVCVRYASEYKTLTIGRSVGAKRIHEVIVISSDSSEDEAVNVVRQKRSRSIKSQNPMVLPRQYVLVPDDSE
ncbi:nuclear condensing complex subunit [Mycena belliarum]|uniref:Nuclear condensing complex subunit n=1 Tax=Mycena belliarum TaxID=1033014 RepID=A0AAD6U6Q6_9AGAR|nr:nuclear condensing complex subunit [Mycena belliae]